MAAKELLQSGQIEHEIETKLEALPEHCVKILCFASEDGGVTVDLVPLTRRLCRAHIVHSESLRILEVRENKEKNRDQRKIVEDRENSKSDG